MIYTLIFTAASCMGGACAVAYHSEHDYPTYDACHKAYAINVEQARILRVSSIKGTCLKHEIPKGEK